MKLILKNDSYNATSELLNPFYSKTKIIKILWLTKSFYDVQG
jgi:hypothetical protein